MQSEGGPAFPMPVPKDFGPVETDDGGNVSFRIHGSPGMSLRDYFAAKIAPAMITTAFLALAEVNASEDATNKAIETVIDRVYIIAGVMVTRSKQKGDQHG